MCEQYREIAAEKIAEMSSEQVAKLLIFMAGMEAEADAERRLRERVC